MAKAIKKAGESLIIPDEVVINKILLIRRKKVMVDKDIAELYGVPTKRLNEQVKRNKKRFPEDFMFQLTQEEKDEVVANCDHLKTLKYSPNLPFVFTEHGAVMLASVLNSNRAIEVNIQIVRIFTQIREMLLTNKDILLKLEQLEKKAIAHDADIEIIFEALKRLINPPSQTLRKRIGFIRDKDEQ
ncbi:ORF6N domain-containing protein [Mucilaginibacter sp.]|uniref:ORF6N domain-containing protein n=1 Tax=Mucilaginibacter sp. TaxID=1882438 RepID=UPI003264EDB2